MVKIFALLASFLAVALPESAWAWGPVTHIHFASLLPWAIPLPHPEWVHAARTHPGLVLAGSLLPDIAIFSNLSRNKKAEFASLHRWDTAIYLLEYSQTEQDRAIALGFVSHLAVDIIAHHEFVPEHQHRWGDLNMITHTAAEWAMDGYLLTQLPFEPGRIVLDHQEALIHALVPMKLPEHDVRRYTRRLGKSLVALDRLTMSRRSFGLIKNRDPHAMRRMNRYLQKTQVVLAEVMQDPASGVHLKFCPQGKNRHAHSLPQENVLAQRLQNQAKKPAKA